MAAAAPASTAARTRVWLRRGAGEAEGGEALLAARRADAGRGGDQDEHGQQQADGADAEHDAQEVRELVLRRVGADVADLHERRSLELVGGHPDGDDEVVGTSQVVVADAAGRRGGEAVGQAVGGQLLEQLRQGRRDVHLAGPGDAAQPEGDRRVGSHRRHAQHGHLPAVDGVVGQRPPQRIWPAVEVGRGGPEVAGDAGVLPRGVALLGPDGRVGRGGHEQQGGADRHAEGGQHEPHDALAPAADGEAGGEADHRAPTGVVARPSRTTTSRSA